MNPPLRLLSTLLVLLIPGIAQAADFEIAMNTTRVIQGMLADDDRIEIAVEDARSYCCQISAENNDSINFFFDAPSVSSGTMFDLIARGDTAPRVRDNTIATSNMNRHCFRFSEPFTGGDNGFARAIFPVSLAGGNAVAPTVKCDETTLFGGFNTVVTDFNFIEITNTLANTQPTEPVVVVIRANAVLAGAEVINQTITLESGERRDIDVHSVAANDFGTVTIQHNAPKGAIRAVNAQYRIVSTSPLDFEPVLVVPFATRD